MAADADCAEAALIEALRSCNHQGIYDRISSFLLPFGELSPLHSYNPKGNAWKRRTAITTAPMKRGSTNKNLKPNALPLRPLANRFLPFLNRALKLLPVLLRKNDKSPNTGVDDGSAAELLQVYALILDCLACISPCLTGKPYSIHIQRFKLVESLEAWGRYEEAEVEALKLLDSLSLIMVEAAPIPKNRKDKIVTAGCYLPDPAIVGVDDAEVTRLVVDVVVVLIGCAYKRKVRNEGTYIRILDLIDQVQPWLRFLDPESHQICLCSLVSKLHKCSLFLLEEYIHFEGGMVQRFCLKMLTECARSYSIDHFGRMAKKIISSVDLQWAAGFSLLRDILRLTLDSILCSCKVFSNSSIPSDAAKISKFFRISSEKLEDLEEYVLEFFKILPSIPIICVSMLGGDYANLIGEMLLLTSFFPAWILLCRLAANNQPIVILLPVDLIQEEIQLEDDISGQRAACDSDVGPVKHWSCPWGYSVINCVLPSFKELLEKNFLSTPADKQTKNACWWHKKNMLNDFLNKLLRTIEISWLGHWGCLLLGERSVTQNSDTMIHKFICAMKSQGKYKINYSLIKAIICGANSLADAESCVQQSLVYKGYFGHGECCGKERFRAFSVDPQEVLEIHDIIKECIMEFAEPAVVREPVILVLDSDVQMLPWENLPILRSQEVYRMPSVSSIFITLDRSCSHHKRDKAFGTIIPAVDPLHTYYLLNPSGDFNNTQVQFEQWFRNLGWEGKAGKIPTPEELILALQTHDLFLYFDHGSGTHYIREEQIQQMDHCAATLLMGCSSGSLTYSGCYAPRGAPLSYLSAGSPAVIATLWDVTDKDIDRFAKSLLSSWLPKELSPLDNCRRDSPLVKRSPCISINKEVTSTSVKTRRKVHNKKSPNLFDGDQCRKRNMIASFISQARESCRFPMLIGAATVCYGVPTIIRKKSES